MAVGGRCRESKRFDSSLFSSDNTGMHNLEPSESTYAGSVLLAHPSLLDPNFRRSVVVIFMHTKESGAAGLIINRPLESTLGEINDKFAGSGLADVPVFHGGPVHPDHLLFAAWGWDQEGGVLRMLFGLSETDASTIMAGDSGLMLSAFLGHAGWGEEQLEAELLQDAWVLAPIDAAVCEKLGEDNVWRGLLHLVRPDLDFLAVFPDDPSLN